MDTNDQPRQPARRLGRPHSYLSRAFIGASYPLRGIVYFLRHPAYYPLWFSRLLPLCLLSLLIYTILFTFAFLPQYAFLAIFHGWGAWVNAVVLVLGEGLVIIQGLFEGFFVDECRVDVFDVSWSWLLMMLALPSRGAAVKKCPFEDHALIWFLTGHAH